MKTLDRSRGRLGSDRSTRWPAATTGDENARPLLRQPDGEGYFHSSPTPIASERRWSFSPQREAILQVNGSEEPSTLGYWLTGHSTEQLCERLGCDADTAMRLLRCGTPCVSRWWTDMEAIADWLRLDSLRLGALLIETEAASVAKTYAVTRGIVGVVSEFGR